MNKKCEPDENEYYAADDNYALIPDGEYYAECKEFKLLHYDGKKRKLYLSFEIFLDGNGNDIFENVYMSFNMPLNKRIGTRSKYYRYWRMAHGKPPTRNAMLSPRIFKNKFYKIKTRTVKQYENGEARPNDKHYSVVDEIMMVIKKSDKNIPTTHFDYEY